MNIGPRSGASGSFPPFLCERPSWIAVSLSAVFLEGALETEPSGSGMTVLGPPSCSPRAVQTPTPGSTERSAERGLGVPAPPPPLRVGLKAQDREPCRWLCCALGGSQARPGPLVLAGRARRGGPDASPARRLREHHRATIKVIRRMQYFVAKKKFQVSPRAPPPRLGGHGLPAPSRGDPGDRACPPCGSPPAIPQRPRGPHPPPRSHGRG